MRPVAPRILPLLIAFLFASDASAEDVAPPVIEVPASSEPLDIAVTVPADTAWSSGSRVVLRESGGDAGHVAQVIPALTEDGLIDDTHVRLAGTIPPSETERSIRTFEAALSHVTCAPALIWKDLDEKSVQLCCKSGDDVKPVLTYNHGVIVREDLPKDEKRRQRACYIHPLYGLDGEILTDDFPRDHYHHHGVFWTWPHVGVGDKHYDLWNVGGLHQRFVRWLAREDGAVAVLGVENAWVAGGEKIMTERVWIRVYQDNEKNRSIDLEFAWIPVDRPITLQGAAGKSYGGLTVRFRPPSARDESNVITVPSGQAQGDLPDTPLAWADYTSRFGETSALSGAAVFIPPTHPDFPPTWLTRYYGPLCVGWPGVEAQTFEPNEPIRLHYRLWVHKGAADLARLEQAYEAYEAAEAVRAE